MRFKIRDQARQPGFVRRRFTYANVMSTIAVFFALAGGSAYAATHLITGKQIAKGTITSTNIKTRSLLSTDFKAGQIPAGKTGKTGPQGATGATGAAGTAVAYGDVEVNSNGNPVFINNSGFPGTVTEPESGVFCVVPPAGYLSTPATLTSFGGAGNFQQFSPQQCPGDYEIGLTSGSIGSGSGFTIVVP